VTRLPPAVIAGFVAVFGAIVGSFLNVCIHRLPRGASVVWPASACPHCRRALSWFENIPIVSFLALQGRCRTCRVPISVRYPIVEGLTAGMFLLGWWYYGPSMMLVSRLVLGCALVVLFAVDLEHHLLPNAITLPGIVVGFLLSLAGEPDEPGWLASLAGIALGAGVLYGVAEAYYRIRHEEGLGMGDVKMLAMVGAFLGWKLTLLTLVMASFTGSLVGVGLIATGRGSLKYALPFGTFLAMGAAAAATVGPRLLDWYVGLL
jgi:leader peptidase (prepilin peptidase)/N-methyltransferase